MIAGKWSRGKRVRNDPAQYDELADEWWRPGRRVRGAALAGRLPRRAHPAGGRPGAVLVDLACGGGLMGPTSPALGYRHVGVDIGLPRPGLAREHGVQPVRGSVLQVPLADGCADVVLAGEILEHVEDDVAVLAECARLLRPGGTLVLDALAAARLSVLINVHLLERLPGGPPRGLHDPALFVDRRAAAGRGRPARLDLRLVGLRPSIREAIAWKLGRRRWSRMKPIRSTGRRLRRFGRKR